MNKFVEFAQRFRVVVGKAHGAAMVFTAVLVLLAGLGLPAVTSAWIHPEFYLLDLARRTVPVTLTAMIMTANIDKGWQDRLPELFMLFVCLILFVPLIALLLGCTTCGVIEPPRDLRIPWQPTNSGTIQGIWEALAMIPAYYAKYGPILFIEAAASGIFIAKILEWMLAQFEKNPETKG